MHRMKLPMMLLLLFLLNLINAFVLPPQQQLDAHGQSTVREYKIRLSRSDLNKESDLIRFRSKSEKKCDYEIIKLCTKARGNQELECSFNKFKFLPFLVKANRLATRENRINFQNIDLFELNIALNCNGEVAAADESGQVDSSVETIAVEKHESSVQLRIVLGEGGGEEAAEKSQVEEVKSLEVNIISASSDFEISVDNETSKYQLLINNTNYLNENTVLVYVIVNINENIDYQLKFQINSNEDEYHSLELNYDEMKPGLYAVKTRNSFNLTEIGYFIFNFDFFLLINGQVNQVKKFQVKFDGQAATAIPKNVELTANTTETVQQQTDDYLNTTQVDSTTPTTRSMLKSIASGTMSLYNIVIIIISITIVLIIVIFFICICLLMMYLCRKYKQCGGAHQHRKSNSKEQIIKVNSDAKLNQIASISSSVTSSSSQDENDTCDSTSSCISAKAISTYNLNKANIRYEKPLKMQQQQQQQQDNSLSISPITTATTITANTGLSNSSSLLVVANVDQAIKQQLMSPSSDYILTSATANHQHYLKLLNQSNHNESYGFYSLKNKNIFEISTSSSQLQAPVEKIYVCNLNNDAQVSSV